MRIFSVAPTLGKGRRISRPLSEEARQKICSPSSSISAPSSRRAIKCRSMGRFPSLQPPGRLRAAWPVLARSAPMKKTEERIRSIRSRGMALPEMDDASMYTRSPCCWTRQPRARRICSAESTSRSLGTRRSSTVPGHSRHAARMGSAAFFEPWALHSPSSRRPPRIRHKSIKIPPVHRIRPFYAQRGGCVKSVGALHEAPADTVNCPTGDDS